MRNGFTLIELLTVIILISVLVVVSFTSISYLTKEREGDVLELKLKTFYSSMSDYMDKKGSIYKEKTKYVYCLSLETFIDETDYKEDDFKEMYNVSDFSNSTIRISFDNPANFTVTVVPTAECSQGERVDTVGVVKSFGSINDDEILDIEPYQNGYVLIASSFEEDNVGYSADKSASFMSNNLNYDVTKDYSVTPMNLARGKNTIYIAMVDSAFNILNKQTLSNSYIQDIYAAINIAGDNIYGLIIDGSSDGYYLSVQLNGSFEIEDSKPVVLPYDAEVEKVIKIKNGFYVSAQFDQNNRPGKESAPYGMDKIILKLDNKGSILWSLPFGSDGDDYENTYYFVVGEDDSVYYTTIVENGDGDAAGLLASNNFTAIIKVDKNGNLLWKKGSSLDFNNWDENLSKYNNNKLYVYTRDEGNDTSDITVFNSNTGDFTTLFSLGSSGNIEVMETYNNELFYVIRTNLNTGIFAGLNPSGDYKYFIVRKTVDEDIVKEIVSENYLDYINLKFDKNGLLLVYKTNSTTDELNIKRIDEKNLNTIKSTVILNDEINRVKVHSFATESIISFYAENNTNDLSSFPHNGGIDVILTRIKW